MSICAERQIERLSQILNRTILARHSKQGRQPTVVGEAAKQAQRRGSSKRRVALRLRRRLKKQPRIVGLKAKRRAASARRNGSLPEPAESKWQRLVCTQRLNYRAAFANSSSSAKEQGYLTFDDLNEALPEGITDADELDLILTRLRRMEIDIIEASEVDRYKDGKKIQRRIWKRKSEPETKVDILDDPVRMYLKQMGQVPLLTREQEVEISKRIEEAEDMVLEAHQPLRFYRTGPPRSCQEADRGQGTIRSGDSRQENREPGDGI